MPIPLRAALVAVALSVTACGASFDVNVKSKATIKSSGLPIGNLIPLPFDSFTALDLSQSQDFKNKGIKKEDIDSVKMTSFKITVVSPSGATLGFLEDISFFVETDGQPRKLIASKTGIADTDTSITLSIPDVELAPYVTAPTMKITTEARGGPPPQDTIIEAALVFDVDPRIF